MSEAGFRAFNIVFSSSVQLLYAALFTVFFHPFLPPREHKKRVFAIFAAYLVLEVVCDWTPLPSGSLGLLTLTALAGLAGPLGLERSLAFLLTLLYFNARISGGLIVESLYFITERLWPFPSEPLEAVFLRSAVLITLFLLSHAAVLAVMLYALQKRLRKQRMPLHWRELCYAALVPTAGILFGQVISRLLIEIKDGVLLQLYERHPGFLGVIPLLALLFFAGAYLTIVFQQGLAALREEQAAWAAERQQAQSIRARIREVEQFYAQIRSLKHEIRGHLHNILGLTRRGAYSELEAYVTRLEGEADSFELAVQTGSPVTDVIVGDAQRRCLDSGVRFESEFHFPLSGSYDAFDVGIILQNLLQNALEATGNAPEERFITLTGKQRGHFFLIEVRNSYTGEISFTPDGLPATTKGGLMHGIGLSNVRRAAEKYMGELELRADGQEFSATVLLQERSDL